MVDGTVQELDGSERMDEKINPYKLLKRKPAGFQVRCSKKTQANEINIPTFKPINHEKVVIIPYFFGQFLLPGKSK